MRFMYDTAAESNTKISFDAVDPFYDALPWFRLIGRYAVCLHKLYVRTKPTHYRPSNG